MLNKKALLILRVGLAITFIWVGGLILQEPEGWIDHLRPWVTHLVPLSLQQFMLVVGVVDIVIGLALLMERTTRLAAQAGVIHLIIVLIVAGVDHETVRDIGLLAATAALAITTGKTSRRTSGP